MPDYSKFKRPNAGTDLGKLYHTKRWQQVKEDVIAREDGICQRCHKRITDRFIVHHVGLADKDHFFDEDRLELLCLNCHNYVTFGLGQRSTYKPKKVESDNKDLIDFR